MTENIDEVVGTLWVVHKAATKANPDIITILPLSNPTAERLLKGGRLKNHRTIDLPKGIFDEGLKGNTQANYGISVGELLFFPNNSSLGETFKKTDYIKAGTLLNQGAYVTIPLEFITTNPGHDNGLGFVYSIKGIELKAMAEIQSYEPSKCKIFSNDSILARIIDVYDGPPAQFKRKITVNPITNNDLTKDINYGYIDFEDKGGKIYLSPSSIELRGNILTQNSESKKDVFLFDGDNGGVTAIYQLFNNRFERLNLPQSKLVKFFYSTINETDSPIDLLVSKRYTFEPVDILLAKGGFNSSEMDLGYLNR